jgi:hypothetical protein
MKESRSDNTLLEELKQSVGDQTIGYDLGWQIEEKDQQQNLYIKKGFIQSIVSGGNYLSSQFFNEDSIQPNTIAKVKKACSYKEGDYFIFFYGSTPSESKGNFLTRIYFNTNENHVVSLIKQLYTWLNKIQLPFEMKCPVYSHAYGRKDSLVLYLNKRYTNYFLQLLERKHDLIAGQLENSIPMFTKQLYAGIGFAESPPDNHSSFGMSRCDLIAKGIFSCIQFETQKSKWYETIDSDLKSMNFNPDAFYLNPYNFYPYVIN